jgi:hypothetical protein
MREQPMQIVGIGVGRVNIESCVVLEELSLKIVVMAHGSRGVQ